MVHNSFKRLLAFAAVAIIFACSGCKGQNKTAVLKDTTYQLVPASSDGIGKLYFGREIAHVMDASGSEWLERSSRQEEENPQQAIDSLTLNSTSVVADIGAGTGYYTFRIAKKIPQGKVYAVEVQDGMIQQLEQHKALLHQQNVMVVKGTNTSPNLPDNSVDLAIMVDVYHELDKPHEILQALYKSLKPGGKLLLLEYRAEDASIPIKPLHKLSVAQANKELAANGFILYQQKEFLPIQHYLLYAKEVERK